MDKRELAKLALSDGEIEERVSALLRLLELPSYECKLPQGKLSFPEEKCQYHHNGDCWINIPDSVQKCKGICSNFE